jgi:hypothetical protein
MKWCDMTRAEVIALMQTSRDENEWNQNYDKVCESGFPGNLWWETMMMSGIADRIRRGWLSTAAKGLLADLTPNFAPGSVRTIELLPPTEDEIRQWRQEQATNDRESKDHGISDSTDDKGSGW